MNIDVNCQLHRQLNELKCSKQMDLVSPCDMMCSYLSVNYLARTVSTIDCGGMSKCAKVNVPKLVPKVVSQYCGWSHCTTHVHIVYMATIPLMHCMDHYNVPKELEYNYPNLVRHYWIVPPPIQYIVHCRKLTTNRVASISCKLLNPSALSPFVRIFNVLFFHLYTLNQV